MKKGAGWIAEIKVNGKSQSRWFNIRTYGSWRLTFLLAKLQRFVWEAQVAASEAEAPAAAPSAAPSAVPSAAPVAEAPAAEEAPSAKAPPTARHTKGAKGGTKGGAKGKGKANSKGSDGGSGRPSALKRPRDEALDVADESWGRLPVPRLEQAESQKRSAEEPKLPQAKALKREP